MKYGLFYDDNITSKEMLEMVKEYDTPKDWSLYKDDDFMLNFLEKYIQRNNNLMNIANENGIKCFRTSIDRIGVFEKILDDLDFILKK